MKGALHLCHVFVFVSPGAPEAAALEAAGLRESFRRRHPGQGTANVCYCFDNAYLELLWVEDARELTLPAIARTRLAERADWRRTGASPFGIAVRTQPPDARLPFPAWDYTPPYLPPGMAIPVAVASDDPRQPFFFRSPGSARPDQWTDGRAGDMQRAAGLAEIVGVQLTMPGASAEWPGMEEVVSVERGAEHRMTLTLSGADGTSRRLSLPDFSWLRRRPAA